MHSEGRLRCRLLACARHIAWRWSCIGAVAGAGSVMLTQETPHLSQVVTPRVLTLILAVFIGVVLYLSPLEPRLLVSTEAFVYLLLLLACASHAPLRSAVVQMGTTQGLVVGTLLLLAVGGQIVQVDTGLIPVCHVVDVRESESTDRLCSIQRPSPLRIDDPVPVCRGLGV